MNVELSAQPVRYVGAQVANADYHDGQLRRAIGVQSYQVLRANRSHPDQVDDWGWTYNHAPMLAYWSDRFYLEYLSNPVSEHGSPGQTLLTSSPDGVRWTKPVVVFPIYKVPNGVYQGPPGHPLPPGSDAVMHQRMGFYVAPDGQLLVLGFYGICPTVRVSPNDGRGIGRVVREVYADGSFGPIYFVRYNRHAGWNEGNTHYPFYEQAPDPGFVEACRALLADRLVTLQWWEEDRSADGFYAVEGYKALSYYHLPDGRVVGLWKWSKAAISEDEGQTWSPVADVPSLVMAGGKIWGQRTSDGRYALVYNPSPSGQHRWPLAVVTGSDGLHFDDLSLVVGEVSPRRFKGAHKDLGQNYVRGIAEGNGIPPDGAMWIAYSMNKEDIWVSRIPVPVRHEVTEPVRDTFNDLETGGIVVGWNVYSPQWAPVSVVEYPSAQDKSLQLCDQDPYDYALAERVFPESREVTATFKVLARQADRGQLYVDLADGRGSVPVRLMFDADGWIKAKNGGHLVSLQPYAADAWYQVTLAVDAPTHKYGLWIDGEPLVQGGRCAVPIRSVERLVFRTGPQRREPTPDTLLGELEDLPNADTALPLARYHVNDVTIEGH